MGLVLQAPAESLLPLADATATGAATPAQTAAATDGLFASLLASFTGSLDPQATEADGNATASQTLPVPLADGKDDDKDIDPFAAYTTLVAQVPSIVPAAVEPAAGVETHTNAVEGLTGSPAEVVIDAAAPAETPAPGAGRPAQPAHHSSVTPSDTLTPEASAAMAAAEQVAATAAPAKDVEAPPAKQPTDAPPTEAVTGSTPVATSVVRSVGNAESDTAADDGAKGNESSRKDHDVRPAPRASESGLVHAAANSAVGESRAAQDAAPVDAPVAPDAPAPSAEVPPQVEHVARTVIERVERGGGEARIHLDPAGLGEVTIHVHTQGDHVRVDVHAERQEAAQLLRDHTQDLSTLLGERGLNLSDVNVGLGRGQSDQTWGQEQAQRNRPNAGEFASIFGAGDGAALETHNRLRAAYNPDGAMVYRV